MSDLADWHVGRCPNCTEPVLDEESLTVEDPSGREYLVHGECYDAEHTKLMVKLKLDTEER